MKLETSHSFIYFDNKLLTDLYLIRNTNLGLFLGILNQSQLLELLVEWCLDLLLLYSLAHSDLREKILTISTSICGGCFDVLVSNPVLSRHYFLTSHDIFILIWEQKERHGTVTLSSRAEETSWHCHTEFTCRRSVMVLSH